MDVQTTRPVQLVDGVDRWQRRMELLGRGVRVMSAIRLKWWKSTFVCGMHQLGEPRGSVGYGCG